MDLVFLPGKRGRKVPLILQARPAKAMDLLAKTRDGCGVSSDYFFVDPFTNEHINAWKVCTLFNFVYKVAEVPHYPQTMLVCCILNWLVSHPTPCSSPFCFTPRPP